ncbi:(Trans)glycosidase [Colletotrichum scovillei]|uniref:(Trans)glycosidase n=1 Tax=Colletotrichum scovillei TaxID=1209932 RepID=UPI0015C3CCD3|nr:(Trans)glycosidase [Colletotrichum scovillei]KAF4783828.1 (Trans)glycosidase [Colletotrichum scovillei]
MLEVADAEPIITTNPVNERPKTAKTAKTAACKVCSIVGRNDMDCAGLPSCTPGPTAIEEPEPEPTPSGEICFASWVGVCIEGNNDFGYVAFKHDDLCGRDSVRVDEINTEGACDLARNKVSFMLCGVEAYFEDSGPYWETLGCGMQLVVDDKRYPAVKVGSSEAPCFGTCTAGAAFGSAMGVLKFPNVPICE